MTMKCSVDFQLRILLFQVAKMTSICLPISSKHRSFCILVRLSDHISSYSKLEMKQIHIHNGINLLSIRVIISNYPTSLHKTSTLYNACYHSNYCTLWTTLNITCIACWTHWRTLYRLVMFQDRQLLHHIVYPNQTLLQWFGSVITQFDIINKWLSLLTNSV